MIVFYNPHVDDFLAEPPHFRLIKRRPLKKYNYLIAGVLAETGRVPIFVDGTISAFIPDRYFSLLPRILRQWVADIEVRRWASINDLKDKVTLVSAASHGDVLFAFSYKAATGMFKRRLSYLATFPHKIFHLSHYFISTKEKADNLRLVDNLWLAGDSDISANLYFRKFFSWYGRPFVVLPFAVAPRFQVRRPFRDREAKCIATGTYHNLQEEIPVEKYEDYMGYFNLSTYHPVRKLIYEQAATHKRLLISKISLYRGPAERNGIKRLLKHFSVSQKAYFSVDFVDLYNQYRYVIVGEEAAGFPALGAFEAMACGSLLIAQADYYNGWGLTPGEHFVAHDGSLESMVTAIEMLNADPARATKIALAGEAFVNEHFRPQHAYAHFVRGVHKCISMDS